MGERQTEQELRQTRGPWLRTLIACCACCVGCGNTLYVVQVSSASKRLEEARSLGAERSAPYEYFYAREHLRKAEFEAAEADYSDAVELADRAEQYAIRAIEVARSARHEAQP